MGIVKNMKIWASVTSEGMRTNHFHFLNHSDFHFYFLRPGKDGADKDASHQVDLDEDKSLSNLDEGGGFPQYNSQQHKASQKQTICKTPT